MTIHYDNSHMIQKLNGECLKEVLTNYIGDDLSVYIKKKKEHLESTGFENGCVHINFSTKGVENLEKLVDYKIINERKASSIAELVRNETEVFDSDIFNYENLEWAMLIIDTRSTIIGYESLLVPMIDIANIKEFKHNLL